MVGSFWAGPEAVSNGGGSGLIGMRRKPKIDTEMDRVFFPHMKAALLVATFEATWDVLFQGSLLLAGLLVLGLLIILVRRWRTRSKAVSGEPWTLQDLRDLHESGKLSDEEYERLKATMLAAYQGGASESGIDEPGMDEAKG